MMATSDSTAPGFSIASVQDNRSADLLRLARSGMAALAIVVALLDPFGEIRLAVIVVAAAVFLIWSAAYTSRHHEWLIFALILIEVLASVSVLPDNATTIGRYGLEALF